MGSLRPRGGRRPPLSRPPENRARRNPPDASRPAVAEIFITPLGTGDSTIREYIRALLPLVRDSGLKHELTAMGTLVEGPVDEILALVARLHAATFDAHEGTDRVVTHLRLDERRGEPLSLEGKVKGALGLRPDQKPRP